MLRWFQMIMPKEVRFFGLFARHAETIVAGAKALRAMLEGGDSVDRNFTNVMTQESEADDVTREVLIAVRRTFITPFDRGDIKDLISSMDDAIDQMHQTAKAITLFELRSFEPGMREMGDLIVRAANLTVEAVPHLSAVAKEATRLSTYAEEVTRIEGRADELHDEGLKGLFLAHRGGNAMDYIIGHQIYGHLEKVVDRFEDVANEIHSLVIEHA
jgi:predicted phosphate transport protein (TIGR00153 family)